MSVSITLMKYIINTHLSCNPSPDSAADAKITRREMSAGRVASIVVLSHGGEETWMMNRQGYKVFTQISWEQIDPELRAARARNAKLPRPGFIPDTDCVWLINERRCWAINLPQRKRTLACRSCRDPATSSTWSCRGRNHIQGRWEEGKCGRECATWGRREWRRHNISAALWCCDANRLLQQVFSCLQWK